METFWKHSSAPTRISRGSRGQLASWWHVLPPPPHTDRKIGNSCVPIVSEDQLDVRVRDEEIAVGATEDHDAHLRVGCELAPDAIEVVDQREVEQVDRRVVDRERATARSRWIFRHSYPS